MNAVIDLITLCDPTDPGPLPFAWRLGQRFQVERAGFFQSADPVIRSSRAEYLLIWPAGQALPESSALEAIIAAGCDLAHAGLRLGGAALFAELAPLCLDWRMLNPPADRPGSAWRATPDALLLRRALFEALGGFDPAFTTPHAAAAEFGFRALQWGALVEHRPELLPADFGPPSAPAYLHAVDLYIFALRHFGRRWAQYLLLRRLLARPWAVSELAAYRAANRAAQQRPAPGGKPVRFQPAPPAAAAPAISVIIPTLGRYAYLPEALGSLRGQTLHPAEVIVVDQNPPEARRPEIYAGFDDLNLRVIWQDARGQALARNTGLAAAAGELVFLFDDDSCAPADLLEQHWRLLAGGRFEVSTGVSYPPAPEVYELPPAFRYPRLAQTFDTGNCLLPRALAMGVGGLDRNYDFGPGADADLGMRLYLAGCRIVHNPAAYRIHYKAARGGLRLHGAVKYNTDPGGLAPFPPVTQSYYAMRYLSPVQQREHIVLQYLTSRLPKTSRSGGQSFLQRAQMLWRLLAGLVLLPIKVKRSRQRAGELLAHGPRLYPFEASE